MTTRVRVRHPIRVRWNAVAWMVSYVLAIVLANVMTNTMGIVPVGFGLYATAGTYAAGFALLARDGVQRSANITAALAAMTVGLVLSWFLASPALALASACAFAIAEAVDLALFTLASRRRGFVASAALSNVVSAPLDTVVFLWVAGFPITWMTMAGQVVGKLLWATAVPLLLWAVFHALFRKPQHTAHP